MRLLVIVALVFAWAAPVASAQDLNRAAESLRTDPVYVDPSAADVVSDNEADAIRQRIRARNADPMYVLVFGPGEPKARAIAGSVVDAVRRRGTYAIVSGNSFSADTVGQGGRISAQTQAAADEALERYGAEGPASVLLQFVDSMGAVRSGQGVVPATPGAGRGGGGGGGGGFLLLLLFPLLLFGLLRAVGGRKRRKQEVADFTEAKDDVRDDLVTLGDDIRALDLDVEMPGANPEAKARYAEAVEAYIRAEEALGRAKTPRDFQPIGKELEEGRYDIAAARALLEGHEAPERRAPCFFDPRHGPSVTDVEWAPAGGEPRPVPVCAAYAVRIQDGEEPTSREIELGGQRMPYWQAPGQFAPFYAGGMFGGVGGLATGMLFGSMLGGAMYGGWGAGDAYADGGGFGGGDFGGGGGFGGGDFGGGGGFGGGDFGG